MRGRPIGSSSFVKIRLASLMQLLNPNAEIPISKKYAIELGLIEAEKVESINRPSEKKPIEFSIDRGDNDD
jgi:hypothetical protein